MRLDDLPQRRQQVAVDLDGHDLGTRIGQGHGERAQSGADLDHRVAGADPGQPDDLAHGVGVDQEVLPQRPAGAEPVALEQLDGLSAGEGHEANSLPHVLELIFRLISPIVTTDDQSQAPPQGFEPCQW